MNVDWIIATYRFVNEEEHQEKKEKYEPFENEKETQKKIFFSFSSSVAFSASAPMSSALTLLDFSAYSPLQVAVGAVGVLAASALLYLKSVSYDIPRDVESFIAILGLKKRTTKFMKNINSKKMTSIMAARLNSGSTRWRRLSPISF